MTGLYYCKIRINEYWISFRPCKKLSGSLYQFDFMMAEVVNLPPFYFTNKTYSIYEILAETILLFVSSSLVTMPVCDICCEELPSEAEMRTHLLLGHMENVIACPFCSLSGVSYDELSFHINTAHIEKDCKDMNATVVDSGQQISNDWIAKSLISTRTSSVKHTHKVSQASSSSSGHSSSFRVNGMTSPITGTTLSQETSTSLKSSPPAAATASGAIKLDRITQTPSTIPRREREDGHRKSKQKRLSSPIKGALHFTT